MKKYRGYLLVLLIAFCIQGCSKQQDVEDHSFVLAMGFERLNEKKVLVRYSYADFDKAQSDSGTVSERMLDFDDHQQVISSKPSPVSGVQFSYDDVINKVKNFDKPQRKITEIRIFYDDQTWETFVPKK